MNIFSIILNTLLRDVLKFTPYKVIVNTNLTAISILEKI